MDLSPTMLELDPEFNTEPKVDKTICRVWRDTRYTKDPSLYRDHMWIIFKRGGRMHGTDHPGMYVEINQDGFSYGCGFYYASTPSMEKTFCPKYASWAAWNAPSPASIRSRRQLM